VHIGVFGTSMYLALLAGVVVFYSRGHGAFCGSVKFPPMAFGTRIPSVGQDLTARLILEGLLAKLCLRGKKGNFNLPSNCSQLTLT